MRYLKTYEGYKYKKMYWLLPTDRRYLKSIKEIGCPLDYAKDIRDCSYDGYIFISYDDNDTTSFKEGYGYMPFEKSIKCRFFEKNNYIFKGTVNLKKEEIDKILMMSNIKKYNI